MKLQLIGIKNLTDAENSTLNRIYKKSSPKLERGLNNASMVLEIRKYDSKGKKARFAIHAQINDPSVKFLAKSEDWEFAAALHKVFDKLGTEITKKEKKRRQKTVTI